MEKEIKTLTGVKPLNIQAVTSCEATAQMLRKAERDGVETAFHRADSMKACPIGADSACCKHCAMGPCRLSSKDPYGKVGVCGATIDTIMSRNFARMVACRNGRPHRSRPGHAGICFGTYSTEKLPITRSKIPSNWKNWPANWASKRKAGKSRRSPPTSTTNWSGPISRSRGKSPLPNGSRPRPWKPGANRASSPGGPCGR